MYATAAQTQTRRCALRSKHFRSPLIPPPCRASTAKPVHDLQPPTPGGVRAQDKQASRQSRRTDAPRCPELDAGFSSLSASPTRESRATQPPIRIGQASEAAAPSVGNGQTPANIATRSGTVDSVWRREWDVRNFQPHQCLRRLARRSGFPPRFGQVRQGYRSHLSSSNSASNSSAPFSACKKPHDVVQPSAFR